jgi:hypothetical protein
MYWFMIIPNWRPQHLPYRQPLIQSLRQVKRFITMPRETSTQQIDLSDPSSKSDRDSTNFTKSDRSAHRSDLPEGQTLAQLVFDAYKKEDHNVKLTSLIRRDVDASNTFWEEYSQLYQWCEGQLDRPIGVGALRMFNAYWDCFDGVEDWSLEVHTAVRDLVNPYPRTHTDNCYKHALALFFFF